MRISGDLHCHTLASTHAYSTLEELIFYASRKKLAFIAITDHGPALPDGPHEWHFTGLSRLPKYLRGVRVLGGCELNLLDADGSVDLPVSVLQKLDFVIASMHSPTFSPATVEEHTQAWLSAAANPLIDCLGHVGQPEYPFDIDAVVRACAETGTLIEINSASFSIRPGSAGICREVALCCKARGVSIAVTSDAHDAYHVGNFFDSISLLEEIDFPHELVVNSTTEHFAAFARARKGVDLFQKEAQDGVYWD